MALPELYRTSREGSWFGLRQFVVYMIDGVYQVRLFFDALQYVVFIVTPKSAVVFFIILYGYFSPSARNDGYDVGLYEFSTVRQPISFSTLTNISLGYGHISGDDCESL